MIRCGDTGHPVGSCCMATRRSRKRPGGSGVGVFGSHRSGAFPESIWPNENLHRDRYHCRGYAASRLIDLKRLLLLSNLMAYSPAGRALFVQADAHQSPAKIAKAVPFYVRIVEPRVDDLDTIHHQEEPIS